MAPEKRDLFRQSAFLVQGNDSERSSTAGVPIDGQVFGIGLSPENQRLAGGGEADRCGGDGTLTKLVSQAFLEM